MATVPSGNVTLVGVEVITDGRDDSRRMYGVSFVVNVNRKWPTLDAIAIP